MKLKIQGTLPGKLLIWKNVCDDGVLGSYSDILLVAKKQYGSDKRSSLFNDEAKMVFMC
jgi:hypothetical protein